MLRYLGIAGDEKILAPRGKYIDLGTQAGT